MHMMEIICALAALLIGGVIGLGFGHLQQLATRRHEAKQRAGTLGSGWNLIPGSGARVAYLLIALVIIQFVCPILFADGTQWWVSGGLLAGYGWTLLQELRRRVRAVRN
jgi:hypothetical protein